MLSALCKRLHAAELPRESMLFGDGSKYRLVMLYGRINDMTLSVIREYGPVSHIGKLQLWMIEEHTDIICASNAVETLASRL